MKAFSFFTLVGTSVVLVACAGSHYPEWMTAGERKQYYADYNNSRTKAEWDSISQATQEQLKTAAMARSYQSGNQKTNNQGPVGSVAFKIRNNSIFPRTVKIAGNALDFQPFGLRYVGFQPGTEAYLHRGGKQKDRYLFTVTAVDEGRTFKIFGE